jgi:hypothetical protein
MYQVLDKIQALFRYRAYDELDVIEKVILKPTNDILHSYTRVVVYFQEDPRFNGRKRSISIFQDHLATCDYDFDNKIVLEEYENNDLKRSQWCRGDSNDNLMSQLRLEYGRCVRVFQRTILDRKSKKLGDDLFGSYPRIKQKLENFLLSSLRGGRRSHRKVHKLSNSPKYQAVMSKLNGFFQKRIWYNESKARVESLQKQGRKVHLNKKGYIVHED